MNARVLVVDDDPGVRYTLRRSLEAEGLEVEEARRRRGRARALAQPDSDLVITDLRMPRARRYGAPAAWRRG